MSKLATLAVIATACGTGASPSMPWLRGFDASASSDVESPAIAERLAGLVGTRDDGGYGGIAVPFGDGTVLASFHQGVAVVNAAGAVIAHAPGFDAEGSADDLVALAVGEVGLDKPIIVEVATRGGHRESTTSIIVWQIGRQSRLERVFEGSVEEHDGDRTIPGVVVFVPQGLVYQRPGGAAESWRFDVTHRRYVQPATSAPR